MAENKASALVSRVGHGDFHGRDGVQLMGRWRCVSGMYCMQSHVVSPTLMDAFVLPGCLYCVQHGDKLVPLGLHKKKPYSNHGYSVFLS